MQPKPVLIREIWSAINPVGRLLGALSVAIAIGTATFQVVAAPSIHPNQGQVGDPFDLEFSIHNPSWMFEVSEMHLTCILHKLAFHNGPNIYDNTIEQGALSVGIPRSGTILYNCPFHKFMIFARPIDEAVVSISGSYKTYGATRHLASETFNWSSQSHEWTEGRRIN